MAIPEANSTLRRLRNRYRLVVMNEDTYEEVVAFKLSRISVYIALSTLFVVLVGLTVALIAFTPLKLYIPGFGDARQAKEYQGLKVKADSIERTLIYKQQYIDNIQKVLKGEVVKQDTTPLKLKPAEKTND
ncbi:MAG: hypothetical protein JWO92_1014 [Chitinophagaceae bacterium]|nr:hypothetical protein [Chitinophagaceae bacterium]